MTLAYSFAASLAGRRTRTRRASGTEGMREEGRDGLGGQCEHRYLCVRRCGSRSPSLASPLLSSGEGEAGEARPRWTAQWLGRPTKEEGGPRATDRLVPPFAPPPADAFLTRTRPAFSLLPSFWALPSFSLPLEGPSDLRLCPSVRWSFPTCSAIQAVPPLSVVPAGGPALALVPFLSPTKSQIKGKEGKAEDAMRKESQMEHGPHLSDGPREGAS